MHVLSHSGLLGCDHPHPHTQTNRFQEKAKQRRVMRLHNQNHLRATPNRSVDNWLHKPLQNIFCWKKFLF